jgi:hypothetical protein
VSGVTDRRAGRKQPDSKFEPERHRGDRDPIHRYSLQLASFQATDGGMRQSHDAAERPLTKARAKPSPAQFVPRALPLPAAKPNATLADAIVSSHPMIMRTGPYLSLTTGHAAWLQDRS